MLADAISLLKRKDYSSVIELLGPCVEGGKFENWRETHVYILALAELGPARFFEVTPNIPLKFHPNLPGIYFDIGNIFLRQNELSHASNFFKKGLDVAPKSIECRLGLAKALLAQKNYKKSEALAQALLHEVDARRFELHQLSSKLRYWQDDFAEALVHSEKSVGESSQTPTAIMNHAVILADLRRFEESKIYFERALQLRPDYDKAHQYYGQVLLHEGLLQVGFDHYSWRWKNPDFPSERLRTSRPELQVSSVSLPPRLLVWGEQGLGEQVLFGTVLGEAVTDFTELIVQIDDRLLPLYEHAFKNKRERIRFVGKSEALDESEYDAFIPFGNLVARYRSKLTDLTKGLNPLFSTLRKFTSPQIATLKAGKRFVCGISWTSVGTQYGKSKSRSLDSLASLISNDQVTYVSLQYGNVSGQINAFKKKSGIQIHQVKGLDPTTNIAGLASLIDSCDFVLSTSNFTVHLAGSLGKDTLMLQPKGKSLWFWDHRRSDGHSLWYPSVQVISEFEFGDDWLCKAQEEIQRRLDA